MASDGLAVGDSAPDFSAPLVGPDGSVTETSLSSLLSEGAVLLCFYPNDFSPDCIDQWCSFRDYDWFSTGDAVQVVGISKSRPATHQRFIDYLGLGFPLFSDTDLAVAESYGVVHRVLGVTPYARRSCFLIDDQGTVRYRWLSGHPLDDNAGDPPISDIHEAVGRELDVGETESFGFS